PGSVLPPGTGPRIAPPVARRHRLPLRARTDARGHTRRARRRAQGLRLPPAGDGQALRETRTMAYKFSRAAYADMFGPTTGDKVRLADTELFIEVERDFTTYGEEVKFGGGKVIRDGMGQSQTTRAQGAVDTVITNALVVDHWGIVKA